MKTLRPASSVLCAATVLLAVGQAWAYQDDPQDIGDLVYRDSNFQIYGRDGVSVSMAISHPGHVGIYVGNGQVVEALGHGQWGIPDVTGEVMQTPLAASAGVHSFYEDWDGPNAHDGVPDHGHMGAKTHNALLNNANALTLRQNIKMLALNQIGEGYDNNFSAQKGPGNDDWTCVGFGEAVYEWCAGQTLPSQYASYGDQSQYAGGLNITPDGYEYHFNDLIPYYQNHVEFSQLPAYSLLVGRPLGFLGLELYIFFPYTQFEQSTLIDAFPAPTPPGPTITSVTPRTLSTLPLPQTQLITIIGTGFTSSSRLTFNDGVNPPYTGRVPASWTATQLTFNIAVGPNPATWTVKVVNGASESLTYSFYVVNGTKTLTSLSINGPAAISENGNGQFTATAYFSDSSQQTVTSSATWSENSSVTTISSSGLLSAGSVGSDTPVTVSASYLAGGITKTASANVTIVNSGGGGTQTQELVVNGGYESGTTGWSATTVGGGTVPSTGIGNLSYPHGGSWYAYLGNVDNALGSVHQFITIPATAQSVTLSFYLNVVTTEVSIGNPPFDVMDVNLRTTGDTVIRKMASYSEADKGGNANGAYTLRTMDLTPYIAAYKGQQVLLQFFVDTDGLKPTIFRIDDVSVQAVVSLPVALTSLAINGPSSVTEGHTAQYSATAVFSDGSTQTVTPSTWGENSSATTISSSGLLTAGQVSADTSVTVHAVYTYNGVTRDAYKDVTVVNVAPVFSYLAISGPSSINENSSGQFTATAIFSDGSSQSVSPSWSENSTATSISASGQLTAGGVSSDTTVTVSASHTIGGVTRYANQDVLIVNIPSPVTLSSLSISGPSSVDENSTAQFSATASFSDGSLQVVSPTWSENSSATSISIFGLLSAGEVASDTPVAVSASYTAGGITRNAQKAVTVINLADTTPPTVTINQAAGQSDPTSSSLINFTVVFSESVTGFGSGDVTLGGTAGANGIGVAGSGTTYNVAVSGMSQSGTVTVTISAGAAQDADGNPSLASTSTDNSVSYTMPAPAIAVRGNGQPITDGDTVPSPSNFTDFSNVDVGGFRMRRFVIANNGTGPLNLTGTPKVQISGGSGFYVSAQPDTPVAENGGTATFDIEFWPNGPGLRDAMVSIPNNDSDKNPYTFAIQGTGTAACNYQLSSSLASHGPEVGAGNFQVLTAGACEWQAVQSANWIHTTSHGPGNGSVEYSIEANPDPVTRVGQIYVGNVVFSVQQAGASCPAVYWVSNTDDAGPGSLRQALLDANAACGGRIVLSNVAGSITLTSGELVIGTNVSILGPGAATLAVSGNNASRVFNIQSGATVAISHLTVQDGLSTNGGGIYNGGTLTLTDCVVSNNLARDYDPGGKGGGIYNDGILALERCDLIGNSCAGRWLYSGPDLLGSSGGSGGGIYNAGRLTVSYCRIGANETGDGIMTQSTFNGGTKGGGSGAGICNLGEVAIDRSTIHGNLCGDGGSGGDTQGNAGGWGGAGGGIWNGGILHMTASTVSANHAGDGRIGANLAYIKPGGAGGNGGGICNYGSVLLTNCTLAGNVCGNGGPGGSSRLPLAPGADGGAGGNGGALWRGSGGGSTLVNCTVTANAAGVGGAGGSGYPGDPGTAPGAAGTDGYGGGLGVTGDATWMLNTLVAGNTAARGGPDVGGGVASDGYNLVGNSSGSAGFGAIGDLLDVEPLLGPLGDHGGPTFTCALLPGSPAIDAGKAGVVTTDQTGALRPFDMVAIPNATDGTDIGAVEFINNTPTVSVIATDADASEPGLDTGTVTFTRTGPFAAELTVNFSVGGTATEGADYVSIGTTVSFTVGSANAVKSIHALPDELVEPPETVEVTLLAGPGYTIRMPALATVTIRDRAPALRIVPQPGALSLRWSMDSGGFVLEESGDLVSWTPVAAPISVADGYNGVTLTQGPGNRFFRLRSR